MRDTQKTVLQNLKQSQSAASSSPVSFPSPSLSHHLPSHGAFVLLFPYTLQLMSANKIHSLYPWRFTKSALSWDWGQHKIRFHFAILQFPLVEGSVESGLEHKMKQLLLAALCHFCDNFAKDDIRARTPTEKNTHKGRWTWICIEKPYKVTQ